VFGAAHAALRYLHRSHAMVVCTLPARLQVERIRFNRGCKFMHVKFN